jgi:hypothetical protein
MKSKKTIRLFLALLTVILLAPPTLFAFAKLYTIETFFIDELHAMILLGFGLVSFAGFLRLFLKGK